MFGELCRREQGIVALTCIATVVLAAIASRLTLRPILNPAAPLKGTLNPKTLNPLERALIDQNPLKNHLD